MNLAGFSIVALLVLSNVISEVESRIPTILNGYEVSGVSEASDQTLVHLKYTGEGTFYVKPSSRLSKHLTIVIRTLSQNEVSIKIRDATNSTRWEVPEAHPFANDSMRTTWRGAKNFEVKWDSSPFNLRVLRSQTQEVIFDTSNSNLIYSEEYLEFTTVLPSDHLYGLGDRAYKFQYSEGTFTILNKDKPRVLENGTAGNGLYGSHPVMMIRESSGPFDMLLIRTTNALDFIVARDPQTQKRTVTFKIAGGIIDLRFFLGDKKPETAVKLYHEYLGTWLMPSFWGMGFHQSRWGYKTLDDMKEVARKYKENDLPLDVIWSDIDYLKKYEDFTIDEESFKPEELEAFLKSYKLRYIPIIDAGIAIGNNTASLEGTKRDVFIRSGVTGDYLRGAVWPGSVNYVDFLHPNATQYWVDMLSILYEKVKVNGIWLDMNEPSNFCPGECESQEMWRLETEQKDRTNKATLYSPDIPYNPGNATLDDMTISPSGVHYGGVTEFHVHNTFGYLETMATNEFLRQKTGTRFPYIISRSTLWGHGKYGAHWTGDNYANWTFLRISIPHVLNFNLFGIPNVGSDICGFDGNTTEELCSRWTQVGALYPFSRNHNILNAIAQEPYALGEIVLKTSRINIKLRYALLKYYYTVFVSQRGSGTVWRPMFFEFPDNDNVYREEVMNEQFLIGSDLMVTPVLHEGVTSVNAYFPRGLWFDLHTGRRVQEAEERGQFRTVENRLPAPVPIFVRAGSVIHMQDSKRITRTEQLNNQFELIAALKKDQDGVYRSWGKMMDVANFSDEAEVDDKCVQSNCIINVSVESTGRLSRDYVFRFIREEVKQFEDVSSGASMVIRRIKLYGTGQRFALKRMPRVVIDRADGSSSKIYINGFRLNNHGVLDIMLVDAEIRASDSIFVRFQGLNLYESMMSNDIYMQIS